jgi:hypothetical protein
MQTRGVVSLMRIASMNIWKEVSTTCINVSQIWGYHSDEEVECGLLPSWRWRQYVPRYNGNHIQIPQGIIIQKITIDISRIQTILEYAWRNWENHEEIETARNGITYRTEHRLNTYAECLRYRNLQCLVNWKGCEWKRSWYFQWQCTGICEVDLWYYVTISSMTAYRLYINI